MAEREEGERDLVSDHDKKAQDDAQLGSEKSAYREKSPGRIRVQERSEASGERGP